MMNARMRSTLAAITVFGAGLVAGQATAQDAECFPDCRTGHFCANGVCERVCEPACASNQQCHDGTCEDIEVPIAECFPACRAGFTCNDGQCQPDCDPACGSTESCLSGSCVPLAVPEHELPTEPDAVVVDSAPPEQEEPVEVPPREIPTGARLFLQVGGGVALIEQVEFLHGRRELRGIPSIELGLRIVLNARHELVTDALFRYIAEWGRAFHQNDGGAQFENGDRRLLGLAAQFLYRGRPVRPWYLGLGLRGSYFNAQVSRTDNLTEEDEEVVAVGFGFGPVVTTGFLFGSNDQWDISMQAHYSFVPEVAFDTHLGIGFSFF